MCRRWLIYSLFVMTLTIGGLIVTDGEVVADDDAVIPEKTSSPAQAGALVAPLPADEPDLANSVPVAIPEKMDRLPVLSESQIPLKVGRYARRYVALHDKNGDGVLQASEWKTQRIALAHVDADANGELTWLEIASRIVRYGQGRVLRPWIASDSNSVVAGQNRSVQMVGSDERTTQAPQRETRFFVPGSRRSSNLPKWFVERDRDGDGQLTLREFAPNAGVGVVRQFREYDRNHDGVIIPRELLQTPASKKKSQPTEKSQ